MIKLHHLNDSRSQMILWLLEELGLPYELASYKRDPVTLMGPAEIKALHPVGKSPMIEDDGRIIIESGAIAEHILRKHEDGRLAPPEGSVEAERHLQWLYYGVSSGMNPIMLKVYARALGLVGTDFDRAADAELAQVLSYLDAELEGREFLLGDQFTAADIQVSFIPELALTLGPIDAYPNVLRWLTALRARPAFLRSVAKGGRYTFAEAVMPAS